MKRIEEIDLENKRVVLRCDFNVPMENGEIFDNSKIKKSLDTIKYLQKKNCKIIILSHFGKIKTKEDMNKYSLKPVAEELSNLLNTEVDFLDRCYGSKVKEIIEKIDKSNIILLENTRFMDLEGKKESGNNEELSKFWATLGDVYINDAFGSSHRSHASTVGITKYIPYGIGFLVEKELDNLKYLINIEKRPFTIFMGGSKVEEKLPIIKKLLPKCDYLLLGGGILNSFLKAIGDFDIKKSLASDSEEILNEIKKLINDNKDKIIMTKNVIWDNDIIVDISMEDYKNYFEKSNLIFVNGTPGKYEDDKFSNGTKEMFNLLENKSAMVIIGGGDTASAVNKLSDISKYFYVSSGGGATLELIANGYLPALKD